MICPDRSTIMLWIDGELSAEDARSVSDHVNRCSECRSYVSTQKQIESAWRDAWTDPAESEFATMRNGLKPKKIWWQTRQTWYIAAVICAAYIGVKMYYLDGAGTSLSDIAVNQTAVSASDGDSFDDLAGAEQEPRLEEAITSECEDIEMEEQEEEDVLDVVEEVPEIVTTSRADAVPTEILEDQSIDLALLQSSDSVFLGHAVGTTSAVTIDAPVMIENVQENSERNEFYRSVSGSDSEETLGFPGAGVAEGTGELTGGGGGFSGVAYGGICGSAVSGVSGDSGASEVTALPEETEESQYYSDDSLELQVYDFCSSSLDADTITLPTGFSISITLSSKEVVPISRHDWDSLFSLIDVLLEENCYPAAESLVFIVNANGLISGHEDASGAVIEVPEAFYADCTVSVLFY